MPIRKRIKANDEDPLDLITTWRTSKKRYEFLARLAITRPSMQYAIDERVFPPGWEKRELEPLRRLQRKQGYKDEDFLHDKHRRAMGLPAFDEKK